MNYWERWIGDWKRKTAHCSLEEKGAYGELLDYLYANETHTLPAQAEAVYRIAGAQRTSERRAIDAVLRQFFILDDAGYHNKRAMEEIEKRRRYIEHQRLMGKRRWEKQHKGNGADHAPDLLDAGEVLERIQLKDGSEFEVRESFVAELDRLYPNVDPEQTLREIRGWCLGNPAKLKTARGVRRFIVAWFNREQEKHGQPQR